MCIWIPLLLLLLYGLAGFFLAPSLLTRYLCSSLQAATNIEFQVGRAVFNPFTFRLQLFDILGAPHLSPSAVSDTPPLRIKALRGTVSLSTLLQQEIKSEFLEIDGATVNLIRFPDNSYNLPLIHPDRSSAGTARATLAAGPRFSLDSLRLKDSALFFDDRLTGQKHRIEQITLDIPSFSGDSSAEAHRFPLLVSAIINGSPIRFTDDRSITTAANGSGTTSPNPLLNQGGGFCSLSCSFADLDLPLYFAYLPLPNALKLSSGKGSGTVTISFVPGEGKVNDLTLAFTLNTADLHLSSNEQSFSLHAPALQVNGSWQPMKKRLTLHSLQFDKPRCAIATSALSSVGSLIFPLPPVHSQTLVPPSSPPVVIDEILVKNGSLSLADKRQAHNLPPWTAIELVVKNFRTTPAPQPADAGRMGSFSLSATQETTQASVSWQGGFNEQGLPEGDLHLTHFPAATLFSFIPAESAPEASGTATLRGHLSLDPTARSGAKIILRDATAEMHDFRLGDPHHPWLTAQKMRLQGMQLQEGDCDLGHISILDGAVSWQQGKRPSLFMDFDTPKKNIFLQSLSFSGTADLYGENAPHPPLRLTDIRLQADHLATTTEGQANVNLTAVVHPDGSLKAQGLLALFPVRSQLSLSFTGIRSEQIAPWLPAVPLFQNSQAIVAGDGKYSFPESSYSGNIQCDSLRLHLSANDENSRATSQERDVVIPRAELIDARIKANPLRISMQELLLHSPRFSWQQTEKSLTPPVQLDSFLQNLLTPASPPPPEAGTTEPKKDGRVVNIQKISFDQGSIQYYDPRLTPPWTTTLSQLHGSITNLTKAADQPCRYELSGLLGATPFTLVGAAALQADQGDFTTRLDLKGFPLQSLTDQISSLPDIDPEAATLDLSLQQQRNKGVEQGEAVILLTGLRPRSAQSNSALPLALLTDQRQQLHLSIPLAPDDSRPLPRIALSSLQTLLTQATDSPWTAIEGAYSDLQERRFVLFAAGQSALDEISQESLRPFVGFLTDHSRIGLTLTGMADPIQDRASIFQRLEENEKIRVAGINEQRLQQWEERQRKRLNNITTKEKQGEKKGAPPAEPRPAPILPESVSVPDALLHDLARERAMQVYDYFTSQLGNDSHRISLEETTKLGSDEEPGTQVIIGLRAAVPGQQPSLP